MSTPLLSVREVAKSFPGVKALESVTFDVRPGTVHALCGENGAGKSTLMKIITGTYQPDAGSVLVRGQKLDIRNPLEALKHGIAMIAQELNFVPDMTIAESFFVGQLPMKFGKVDWKFVRSEAGRILREEGLSYPLHCKLGTLSVSEIQMLEILRAVRLNADVLIMDEPTSAIAHKEVELLFSKIRALRAAGKSIIYISHKMDEVFELADDVSVLRDGTVVSSQEASTITEHQVIAQMVGRDLDHQQYPKQEVSVGKTVLDVSGLNAEDLFEDINLHVKAGEIVGLAGLIGAGRSEVVRAIFGLEPVVSGQIAVNGKPVKISNPRQAIDCGIAMLHEDRRLAGILPELSIKQNATISNLSTVIYGGWAHSAKEERLVRELFNRMNVKAPSQNTKISNLSGGNQQKVLLARWMLTDPTVMLLDEPTRGIDVGAKFEIYKLMTELAQQGRGILMISSELPELIGMCDRIYVMSAGHITAELQRPEFSQETILTHAMSDNEVL